MRHSAVVLAATAVAGFFAFGSVAQGAAGDPSASFLLGQTAPGETARAVNGPNGFLVVIFFDASNNEVSRLESSTPNSGGPPTPPGPTPIPGSGFANAQYKGNTASATSSPIFLFDDPKQLQFIVDKFNPQLQKEACEPIKQEIAELEEQLNPADVDFTPDAAGEAPGAEIETRKQAMFDEMDRLRAEIEQHESRELSFFESIFGRSDAAELQAAKNELENHEVFLAKTSIQESESEEFDRAEEEAEITLLEQQLADARKRLKECEDRFASNYAPTSTSPQVTAAMSAYANVFTGKARAPCRGSCSSTALTRASMTTVSCATRTATSSAST